MNKIPTWPKIVAELRAERYENAVRVLLRERGPMPGARIVEILVTFWTGIKPGSINQAIVNLHARREIELDRKREKFRLTLLGAANEGKDHVTKSG